MKKYIFTILFLIFCFLIEIQMAHGQFFTSQELATRGFANEAQPETYFNKLSKALIGQPPSREDWDRFFIAKKKSTLTDFFQNYIDQTVLRPEFDRKLKFKLDELFRFIPQLLYASDKISGEQQNFLSSYDYLANEVIGQNMPWSALLNRKFYKVHPFRITAFRPERSFYSYLNGSLKIKNDIPSLWSPFDSSLNGVLEFQFDPQDLRLAGVISTPRFLSRYANTALNKNRRRSAAIFRTFLCDTMVAAIPKKKPGDDSTDYDVLLPKAHQGVTEEQLRKSMQQTDIHGSSPDCRACHYKLDPMGETLSLSPAPTINEVPSPGALIYQKKNGSMVHVEVRGLGELGQAITEQTEYIQCQVNHFWTWYVGQDAPRSATRNEQLNKKFIELEGRPKDFVKYLVQSSEFRQKPIKLTEEQLLARQVAKSFKNCTSCHEDQNEDFDMKYWDMTAFPYSENPRENQARINQIIKALDLNNNGAHRKMPPKESVWQISEQELGQIQKWISIGAPDYDGKPQLKTLNQLPVPLHLQGATK